MPKLSTVAIVSLAILLLEHCTSVTLARYTQQRVNAPNPAPTLAVLAAELLKLLMSVALELGHVALIRGLHLLHGRLAQVARGRRRLLRPQLFEDLFQLFHVHVRGDCDILRL